MLHWSSVCFVSLTSLHPNHSPLSPAPSVFPSLLGHSLEHKICLNSHLFKKKKSLPWPFVPIQLSPHPSALYSSILKDGQILAFHSLSNHSNHLSFSLCPWNNSYQGPSANIVVSYLSSSNCILTQPSTLIFTNHFLLLTSMVPHSKFSSFNFYFCAQLLSIEAQESRLPGEISITSDMQMTPPLWQKVKRNSKASWWKWKRRVKKLA